MEQRKKRPLDLSTMVYGKVPPQARELEEAILGAIMLEKEAFDRISGKIRPEMFYVHAHQHFFKAFVALSQRSQPIDVLTVTEALRKAEELDLVGGSYFVTKLTNTVVSSANIEAHADIVAKKFVLREVIRLSGELLNLAYEDSAELEDLQSVVETELVPALQESFDGEGRTIDMVLVKTVQQLEDRRNRKEGEIVGVPTGFPMLDRLIGGWRNTTLTIIAARPACGKTAFMLNLAISAAEAGYPAVIFSLEMGAVELVERLLAMKSDVFLTKIRDARLEEWEMKSLYAKGIQPLAKLGIVIDDKAALSVYQMRARLKKYIKKYGVKIAFGDYLQLKKGSGKKGQNREQEISEISRELKITAKEENIPIVELSQLSREVEKRKTTKSISEPQPSDLRESGALEQDADRVMFLFSPHSDDEINEDLNLSGDIVVKIAKDRAGGLEKFLFKFNKPVQRFEEVGLWRPFSQVAPVIKGNWQATFSKTGTDEPDPF